MQDEVMAVPPCGSSEDQGQDPSRFHAAMVHLYRGEMHRMTVWRQRLDITSNWGILIAVALATFTLGSAQVPHYTLLLGLAVIGISVLIEARRYRHLHHSKWRLYVMEVGYFSDFLSPFSSSERSMWRDVLARDLRHPCMTLGWFLAVRARLRRNYLLVLYFVELVWFIKLFIHPKSPESGSQFLARFAVGDLIHPWLVAIVGAVILVATTWMALTCPSQESLEDWTGMLEKGRDEPTIARDPDTGNASQPAYPGHAGRSPSGPQRG